MQMNFSKLATALMLSSSLFGCAAVVKTPYQQPNVNMPNNFQNSKAVSQQVHADVYADSSRLISQCLDTMPHGFTDGLQILLHGVCDFLAGLLTDFVSFHFGGSNDCRCFFARISQNVLVVSDKPQGAGRNQVAIDLYLAGNAHSSKQIKHCCPHRAGQHPPRRTLLL